MYHAKLTVAVQLLLGQKKKSVETFLRSITLRHDYKEISVSSLCNRLKNIAVSQLNRRNYYSNTTTKVLLDRAKTHYDKSLKLKSTKVSQRVERPTKQKTTSCEGDSSTKKILLSVFYTIKVPFLTK